jgi:hypothetical protein
MPVISESVLYIFNEYHIYSIRDAPFLLYFCSENPGICHIQRGTYRNKGKWYSNQNGA